MNLVEAIILGVLQGVFEWLPVSSEAVISIFMTQLLGSSVEVSVNTAIWLHLGTMLAALIYFRDEFAEISVEAFESFRERDFSLEGTGNERLLFFIISATFFTSVLGGILYFKVLDYFGSRPDLFASITGVALVLTGILRFYQPSTERKAESTGFADSLLVGCLQGLAVIPGVSRSGSTVFGLFLRDFSAEDAFRLSFLLSVPAVLIANVGINLFSGFQAGPMEMVSAGVAFLIGYASIEIVLRVAERTAVAYLCFALAAISFLPVIL